VPQCPIAGDANINWCLLPPAAVKFFGGLSGGRFPSEYLHTENIFCKKVRNELDRNNREQRQHNIERNIKLVFVRPIMFKLVTLIDC